MDNFGKNVMGFVVRLRGATSWAHGPMGPRSLNRFLIHFLGKKTYIFLETRNLNRFLIHFLGKKTTFFENEQFCQSQFYLSKPILSKPILSKPILSKPILSKPILSKPILSKPRWATTAAAAMAEEFYQAIQAPSPTHPGTTYPVRLSPHSDLWRDFDGFCGVCSSLILFLASFGFGGIWLDLVGFSLTPFYNSGSAPKEDRVKKRNAEAS